MKQKFSKCTQLQDLTDALSYSQFSTQHNQYLQPLKRWEYYLTGKLLTCMSPQSQSLETDLSSVSNYCPFSLLSLVSKILEKILEKIIHSRISDFLCSVSCQFGFRHSLPLKSHWPTQESVTNSWHNLLSKNSQVAAVFFDVKKAFHSVLHYHLISALAKMNIPGPLIKCFFFFISQSLLQLHFLSLPSPTPICLHVQTHVLLAHVSYEQRIEWVW